MSDPALSALAQAEAIAKAAMESERIRRSLELALLALLVIGTFLAILATMQDLSRPAPVAVRIRPTCPTCKRPEDQ